MLGLAAALMVEWAGATAVLPVLPLYLRHAGAPYSLIGLVMGAFLAASFAVQYPLGRLSDRLGRRRPLLTSLGVYSVATLGFVLPVSPPVYILLRALQGGGAGTVQVMTQAVVADLVPADRRGRAYSLLTGAQFGGMVVGPLAGALLYGIDPRIVFVVAATAAGLAAAVVAITVPPGRAQAGSGNPPPLPGDGVRRRQVVQGVLLASAGTGLLIGVYDADWSLLLRSKGAPPWEVGLSFTLFALPLVLASWPAGWLADHWDRRWLGGLASLVGCGCAATYPFLPSPPELMALGVVEATAAAIGIPAVLSLLMHTVGTERAGRSQGLAGSAQTGAAAAGAIGGGLLFGLGTWVPFIAAASLVTVMTAALPLLWRSAGRWARAETATPA
ncbi:MAG TPA: MFS transporter [Verrucomicrobiae bacterium]|nr:MFS transporter [Verrucomicrobiae bacterium]